MTQPSLALDGRTLESAVVNSVRAWLGVSGVLATLVGVAILVWPGRTAMVVSVLLAIYLLGSAVAYLAVGVFSRGIGGGARTAHLVLAVIFGATGVIALTHLRETTVWIGVFLGIWIGIAWIADGVIAFATLGDAASKGWAVIFAALSVVAGITLLFSPLWGATVLWWLLGISLVVLGVSQIVRAFTFGRGATA